MATLYSKRHRMVILLGHFIASIIFGHFYKIFSVSLFVISACCSRCKLILFSVCVITQKKLRSNFNNYTILLTNFITGMISMSLVVNTLRPAQNHCSLKMFHKFQPSKLGIIHIHLHNRKHYCMRFTCRLQHCLSVDGMNL